jgi:hypothetical protein
MSELHILNGDFALGLWRQCNFSANALVWKETYIEGPLPETEDLRIFRKARAEYLSTFAELSDIDTDALHRHLKKMDETLLKLEETDELTLWFDACIFDQTILMRILYLLNQQREKLTKIFLYCCKSNCLSFEDFQKGESEKVLLTEYDLKIAANAWIAFIRKDHEEMIKLADSENFVRMPEMRKALLRCAEEIPDENGLTRTQRQILEIISKKGCTFEAIFQGLDKFEEYPFLGDTACLRILDNLVNRGLIKLVNDFYQLS